MSAYVACSCAKWTRPTCRTYPAYSPISLGEDADLTVSPDGSSLAAILRYFHPYSNQPPTPLYLVDLEAWAVKETGVSAALDRPAGILCPRNGGASRLERQRPLARR